MLKNKAMDDMVDKVAITSAKCAYFIYEEIFTGERFKKLVAKGAKPQRLLWASTGTKDPAFSDVKYMEALIGYDKHRNIDTLEAFLDHGKVDDQLERDADDADDILKKLNDNGIDLHIIT